MHKNSVSLSLCPLSGSLCLLFSSRQKTQNSLGLSTYVEPPRTTYEEHNPRYIDCHSLLVPLSKDNASQHQVKTHLESSSGDVGFRYTEPAQVRRIEVVGCAFNVPIGLIQLQVVLELVPRPAVRGGTGADVIAVRVHAVRSLILCHGGADFAVVGRG